MADNLNFSIYFDLEKGVEEAGKEWQSKYADKLEKLLAKRPVMVDLSFSTKNLNNLDDVKKRLAELKIEPLTPENKTAIRELVRELKELAKAMEKVQKYSNIQTPELQQALANKANAEAAHMAEKYRQANERLEVSKRRVALAEQKHAEALSNTSKKINEQHSYVSRLIKRMAVYASFSYAGNFLTSVREVTAQFELQRVSLGAIIQDQTRANALFSEIKSFALKSPVSILDLTKYTKQLAAYKIGYDELFETTKKLTDVSVGLGVSMDRVVLAYGQVRARGALYSSEIRQFTEMGVPIVEELAAKLTKMNGQLVTSAQVLKMVEKGAISFELVKEVFDDMTSAGGIFYNMQEKQGNTLYGMWAKLGDAASVMYDEIGNTESVNKGMKAAIQALTDLMRNWQAVVRYMGYAGVAIAALITRKKILALEITKVDAIQRTYNTRMARANALASANTRLLRAQGVAMGIYAKTMRTASTVAAAFGTSLTAIKGALISTGWGALVVALGYLADKLLFTKSTADKAAEALSKINSETTVEQGKSVRNFEYLAQKAVGAANGSREQKEALDELQRTYKDILPSELLELEYLNRLNGEYGSLTNTIRQYIAEQQRRKAIDEIANIYGSEKQKYERNLTDYFREENWNEQEIARFWEKFYSIAGDKSKSLEQVVYQSLKYAGREGFDEVLKLIQNKDNILNEANKSTYKKTGLTIYGEVDYIDLLRDAVLEENKAIEQNEERIKAAESATNAFAEAQEKAANRIKNVRFFHANGESVDRDSYLGSQMLKNFEVKEITNILKDGFNQAGLAWDTEYGNFIAKVNEKTPELISSLNFSAITNALIEALKNPQLTEEQRQFLENLLSLAQQSKKRYDEIVPSDPVVRVAQTRFRQIAQSAGGFREQYNQYLMKAGEDMASYNKRLKGSLEDLKNKVKGLLDTQKLVAKAGVFAKMIYGVSAEELQKSIDDTNKTIEIIEKTISEQSDYSKDKDTKKSDPRLQNLKEEISLTKKLYDEYHKLEKQIGATKAAEKIQEIYKNTISTLEGRAQKYGFEFELPFTDENLKANMQHFIDKMKELQGLKDKKGKPLFPNIGKEIDEAVAQLEDVDLNSLQKALEKKLKALADRISRTKTAKEFYEKILGQTGDVELATRVSLSIYGSTGEELFEDTVKQIKEVFKTGNKELDETIEMQLDYSIDTKNERINYQYLAEIYDYYQDQIIEKNRSTAENIVKEGQKTAASNIATWEKELAKAKDYEEQRTDIINRETQRRAEIYKSNLPQEEKDRLAAQSQRKQDEDLAKINFDEFTKSEDYIKIFENLDNVATSSLKRLRAEMQALIDTNQNLSPENMKTLVKAMEDIDEQISGRGFGNDMIQSVNDYIASIKNLKIAKQELAEAEAEYQAQLPQLDEDIVTAENEKVEAQRGLNDLKNNELATENQIVAAELRLNTATANVAKAQQAKAKAADKVKKAEQKVSGEQDKQKKATTKFFKDLQQVAATADQLASELGEVKDLLGISEDSAAGLVFDSAISSLQQMSAAINIAASAQAIFNAIAESNPYIAIAAGVLAVGSAIASWISGSKVRKANKEVERQQELLDQLEYTYGRLEKAADKAFGADFVANQKQQQKILLAQQQAYMKQYEAEMSKGKKADKEKAQEFLDKARDVGDQIADMQGKIAERMLGTGLTSAARDFANAWLEAYKEFGNTADAMSEKFHEMIQNMIVESLLAKVMERALKPAFDMIDNMNEEDFYSESFWKKVVATAEQGAKDADHGAGVVMKWIEKMGYDMREMGSEYSGIAKEVSSASSEEINRAAAIGNSLLYYASTLPTMATDLSLIRQLMERGTTSTLPDTTAAGWTDWQQQAMDNYNAIARNTADTVVECRRAAVACEAATEKLNRALRAKGATIGFNVFLNS